MSLTSTCWDNRNQTFQDEEIRPIGSVIVGMHFVPEGGHPSGSGGETYPRDHNSLTFSSSTFGLLFSPNHVNILHRQFRLVGDLIGVHPKHQNQTITLSLPLLVNSYALRLIIDKNIMKPVLLPKSASRTSMDNFRRVFTYPGYYFTPLDSTDESSGLDTASEALDAFIPLSPGFMKWDSEMENKYLIFKDMWERGFYLSGGVKFGVDWLVYEDDPALVHARYMLYVVPWDDFLSPQKVTAMTRLASTVRKTILMAAVDEKSIVHYVEYNYFSMRKQSQKLKSASNHLLRTGIHLYPSLPRNNLS